MSLRINKNPTQFFAVVGAAYIPEHHLDRYGHYLESPRPKQAPFAGLWVLCAATIAALTLLKFYWIDMAAVVIK
jgi:hypothetical protein